MDKIETYTFGRVPELYVEYVKRSEPFTMYADHFHAYYEIYYMLSGKRIYFIRDRSYTVEQGDLVFIAKNELHKTLYAGETALDTHERVIIHFDDRYIHALSEEHAQLLLSPFHQEIHVLRLPRQEQMNMHQIITRLLAEIQHQPVGYEIYPVHAISDLLLTTARYLQQNEPLPMLHATPMHAKISEIVRYINYHFTEPIHLNSLSEQFFISPYYLSRMFKEITGFPFSDYVMLTRIKESQRLLLETDLSISEVAANVGFDNFSHFGKTFKKITRLSPREYRKSKRLNFL